MKRSLFLVPVDFSIASYKAVQYAMMLAQASRGHVKLLHVNKLGDIDPSENPLVIMHRTRRLKILALERLRSLSEMMDLSGVEVTYDVAEGHVVNELETIIRHDRPAVVVLGKKSSGYKSIASLTARMKIPVVIIPETAPLRLPDSVVLTLQNASPVKNSLAPFFEFVRDASSRLSILRVTRATSDSESQTRWILDLSSKYGVIPSISRLGNQNVVFGTLEFIRSCNADLVCLVNRKDSLFSKLLFRDYSFRLANNLDVPVFVIHET